MFLKVFCSYSHNDESLKDELAKHLNILERQGVISTWCENYNGAPADGSTWMSDNDKRLLRGGSWDDDPVNCRSAFRDRYSRVGRDDFIGFRVVSVLA